MAVFFLFISKAYAVVVGGAHQHNIFPFTEEAHWLCGLCVNPEPLGLYWTGKSISVLSFMEIQLVTPPTFPFGFQFGRREVQVLQLWIQMLRLDGGREDGTFWKYSVIV